MRPNVFARIALALTFILSALASATPAFAGVDGIWVNPAAAPTRLGIEGDVKEELTPAQRPLENIIFGFQKLCVATNFDKLAVNVAMLDVPWGFDYRPEMLRTDKGDVDFGGWQAKDASLLIAKDVFYSPNPQCNLTVATKEQYRAYELLAAMRNALGDPDDFEKITLPDGKDNPNFRPMWTIANDDKQGPTRIYARSLSNGNGAYRILLTLMQFRNEAKKPSA